MPRPNRMLFFTLAFCIHACCATYAIESTVSTRPSILVICPRMADISDDLPDPTWPTTATSLPLGIVMLMLDSVGVVCLSDQANEPFWMDKAGAAACKL